MEQKRKLTPEQIQQLRTLYSKGMSVKHLGSVFGVCSITAWKYVGRDLIRHRNTRTKALTHDQIDEVCRLYVSGYRSGQIGKIFGVGASAIRTYLKDRGVNRLPDGEHQRHNSYISDYFETVSSEKQAYWLGFFAADGSVNSPGRIAVSLDPCDRDHIARFISDLKATSEIHDYSYDYGDRHQDVSKFTLRSKKLTCDLAEYGIVQRKTYSLSWPELPEDLYRHFARGYFDGDGGFSVCWHKSDQRYTITFAVTGYEKFIMSYQEYLMAQCQLNRTKLDYRRKGTSFCSVRYSGDDQVMRLFHLLYDNHTVCLPRKLEKAIRYYRYTRNRDIDV